MSKRIKKDYLSQILFNIAILLFFGVLFFTGTFFDEDIASAIYSPSNTIAAVITSTGVYPFFAVPVLLCGALYERAVHSGKSKAVKAVLCTACILLMVFVGFIGGGALAEKNCFGYIFPSISRNYPVIAVLSVIFVYPLFFVGYHYAKKSKDKMLVQRIFGLFVILLLAFIAMQGLKYTFNRPRYRTAVLGYEGIGFVPWYTRFEGAAQYSELYGINGDEFLSFPSGHSILSISAMYILPSLSWIFPKLKDNQFLLVLTGFMFGLIIMFTRMILGAHYLSDVSAGAIIGTLLSIVYTILQLHISVKQNQSISSK